MRKFFQTISYKLNRLIETVGTFGWVALSVNDILVLQLYYSVISKIVDFPQHDIVLNVLETKRKMDLFYPYNFFTVM